MKTDWPAWRAKWNALSFYEKFEQVVVLVLTGVIAVVIVSALWHLILRVALGLVLVDVFDPTDPIIFQTVFGAIFTVIIALEFKRSLLVVAERRFGVVQVRVVVLIAMLAIVRKLIILDLAKTEAATVLALAAAILALGVVYWLVRDQDRRDQPAHRPD
ncbi:protein PsiE [Elioraea sp. Yellowstone]|uniref:phosphate-starvation-inducible PsiE family protein n=1 Tax=Elioraea sp. Yellowstone TaxID=2592070 RepID=UPI00114F527A|nr:phosphate-starvation-inducible PsiE family protein [Elioraea sp. Yellowstone]TQF77536.1 protein PsiE [Elioraea sp. Yellowstone]